LQAAKRELRANRDPDYAGKQGEINEPILQPSQELSLQDSLSFGDMAIIASMEFSASSRNGGGVGTRPNTAQARRAAQWTPSL